MKKTGIFIAGRLNSERLPNKLILPLGKTNLWEIACKKLQKLSKSHNVYALCSDQKLIDIAKKFKGITIIERDPETCNKEGPFKEIFKDLKEVEDSHLMFLNPCLYNLSVETIEESISYFNKSDFESMTSVKKFNNWLYEKAGTRYMLKTNVDPKNWSTKEINIYYQAAHCFHVFNKQHLFIKGIMLERMHDCFEIEQEETFDVDTKADFEFAKWKLK